MGLDSFISAAHQAYCYDFVSDWLHSDDDRTLHEIAEDVESYLFRLHRMETGRVHFIKRLHIGNLENAVIEALHFLVPNASAPFFYGSVNNIHINRFAMHILLTAATRTMRQEFLVGLDSSAFASFSPASAAITAICSCAGVVGIFACIVIHLRRSLALKNLRYDLK